MIEVRVTFPPAQNVVGPLGVIVAVGNGLTVTVNGALMSQTSTATLNVPLVVTTILCVVSPLLHK